MYEIDNYIKCLPGQIEKIEGRWRLAFVRCPKCKEFIGIYHDEIMAEGKTTTKMHLCGFKGRFILKKWEK